MAAGALGWVEASSGVLFAVLLVVQGALSRGVPMPDEDVAGILDHFRDNQSGYLWGTYVNLLASFFGLWFVSILRSVWLRAEGGTGRLANLAFGGFVGGAVLVLATMGAYASIAYAIVDQESPNETAVRGLFDLGYQFVFASAILFAVFFAAAAVLILRTRVMPGWLGWWAAVTAAVFVLSASASGDADNPLSALGQLAFVLMMVWFLIAGVRAVMRQRAGEPLTTL